MKILVISQFYYPEQFRINSICEEMVKEGNEVTVLTGLPNYPKGNVSKEYKFFKKRKENINGVNIIRTFEIGRRKGILFRILNYISYMCSASLKALFLKKDFDVIYIYQLSPITLAVPGIIYKMKNKKKKIHLYCLDLWPESLLVENFNKNSLIYKMTKRISKWIYSKCDYIYVTSKGFIEYFKNELELNKTIKYLPQYADEQYEKIDYNTSEISNFVFAGNIGKAQSVETIIKAANELKDRNDIIIHIVGDGSSYENCKKLSEKMKLNNVIFYGRKSIEEMKEYYKMADAMLITLYKNDVISKTIPGKLQSYMMVGRPIIGAIDGETQKIIKEAECGYCTNSEDYKNLAKLIIKFKEKPINEKQKMASNSYSYYEQNFTKNKHIQNLLKFFKEENDNV